MPPRKKPRLTPTAHSPPAFSTNPSSPSVIITTQPPKPHPTSTQPFPPASPLDPWTPEQEISLFKALIRYKPTGLHKHFHMLCISAFLRSHGHSYPPSPVLRTQLPTTSTSTSTTTTTKTTRLPTKSAASNHHNNNNMDDTTDTTDHTRIPSIWIKLSNLYDLDALDEREEHHSRDSGASSREGTAEAEGDEVVEFALPEAGEDEFGEMMWGRRLKKEGRSENGSESEAEMPWLVRRGGVEKEELAGREGADVGEREVLEGKTGRKGRRVVVRGGGKQKGGGVREAKVSATPTDEGEGNDEEEEEERAVEDEDLEEDGEEESVAEMPDAKGARSRGRPPRDTSRKGKAGVKAGKGAKGRKR